MRRSSGIVDAVDLPSPMNEQDVRALVREAIERHLGRPDQGVRGEGQGVSPTVPVTFTPHPLPLTPRHHSPDRPARQRGRRRHVRHRAARCAAIIAGSASRTGTRPWRSLRFSSPTSCPRLPSRLLQAVGDVEVYRDGVLVERRADPRACKGKQALVVAALDKIDKDVIDAGSDLKIVSNVAVGYNNLDVPYARSKGIVLTNTPDVLTEATANMAITLILAVTRRIVEGDRARPPRRVEGVRARLHDRIGRPRAPARHHRAWAHRTGRCREGAPLRDEDRLSQPLGAIGRRLREHVARPASRDVGRRSRCTCRSRRRRGI